ncbi:MAG TPA: hypothetical protein DCE56_19585 [Cyanobacteria bacterium UBA8553]|nr:hypothetical protein [Cyanobacteria bacterium UBA8553]
MEDILATTASPFDFNADMGTISNNAYGLSGVLDNHQIFGTALNMSHATSLIGSELEQLTIDPAITTSFDSGIFTVGDTGEVSIDFLLDSGEYRGELALFSLEGMEQ